VKLCGLIGMEQLRRDPKFATNAVRMQHREELKAILNEKFATRGKMEWTLDLVKLGLPAGPIFDLKQVFEDPHVNQTGMVEEIEHPTLGPLRLLASPLRMQGMGGKSVRSAPPALGADSREVLGSFGVPAARIEELIAAGVVQAA